MNILILSPESLSELKHYAELRYSISQIATMLRVDPGDLRIAIQGGNNDIAEAYNAGKTKSSVARRELILAMANKGQEWAVKLLDKYEKDQLEDELRP